ncbi:MAG: twin-arginine translocation signal domain-containing protein, partial [Flavitalea sp.]
MKNKRRDFLKLSGLTGLSLASGGLMNSVVAKQPIHAASANFPLQKVSDAGISVIGAYGPWANSLNENKLPSLSFRNKQFTNLGKWKKSARTRLTERLATPVLDGVPAVTVNKQYTYDGLHIEELSWQLPYGPPTAAIL